PGNTRPQIHAGKNVGVIPDGANAITPGSRGNETIVFAVFADVLGVGVVTQGPGIQTLTGWEDTNATNGIVSVQRARSIARITSVAQLVGTLQAPHMGYRDLANQSETRSSHYLVEEVSQSRLELSDLLTFVAMGRGTEPRIDQRHVAHARAIVNTAGKRHACKRLEA